VRHRLIAPLGGGVERDRVVDVVVLAKRDRLVGAVDRARGTVHQVPDLVVTAALEDVHKTDQIRVDIGVWVLKRVPDPGLCAEVHHTVKTLRPKQLSHPVTVRQIQRYKPEAVKGLQLPEPGLLETDLVEVVQVVGPHNFVAPRAERPRDVVADKPGRSGD